MQLQEQRLSHASAELDGVRSQLAAVLSQPAENAKRFEERLTSREASLRAQEADASLRVKNEQAKWQGLAQLPENLLEARVWNEMMMLFLIGRGRYTNEIKMSHNLPMMPSQAQSETGQGLGSAAEPVLGWCKAMRTCVEKHS